MDTAADYAGITIPNEHILPDRRDNAHKCVLYNPVRRKAKNINSSLFRLINGSGGIMRCAKCLFYQAALYGAKIAFRCTLERLDGGHVPLATPGKMIGRDDIAETGYLRIQVAVSAHRLTGFRAFAGATNADPPPSGVLLPQGNMAYAVQPELLRSVSARGPGRRYSYSHSHAYYSHYDNANRSSRHCSNCPRPAGQGPTAKPDHIAVSVIKRRGVRSNRQKLAMDP